MKSAGDKPDGAKAVTKAAPAAASPAPTSSPASYCSVAPSPMTITWYFKCKKALPAVTTIAPATPPPANPNAQGPTCPPSDITPVAGGTPTFDSHHCITGYVVGLVLV